ncbi:MAG: GNAT family N-acetyltransferase [Chloroflexi bacterium]|nr:GNAT family N-acetyltransferase [Chloroflexota bacterium]
MTKNYQIRPALIQDQQDIANMMFFERHVHRHLDWRHPTEWLGSPFYWALERNDRIVAVLACPQDRNDTTWLRLFTHLDSIPSQEAWKILWENAKKELGKHGKIKVAAISLKVWMQELLQESGFVNDEQIVMLSWAEKTPLLRKSPEGIMIRPMEKDDLPKVVIVDTDAFTSLWQNPLSALEQAYARAVIATVAETSTGRIIGYQISTKSPFGAHLARLAVHSEGQRRGIASALISDLTEKLLAKEITQLSVNTQSTNERSLSFYQKNGFKYTEEEYPLYSFQFTDKKKEKELQWDTVKMP